jgi:magnesium transporter
MEAFITDGLPVKQWYCSALQSDGQTSFANAESADGFKDILEKSTIAWVDFRTDEYQTDVKYAANQLGFTDALISSFSTGPRNLYEDLTTELGIKLPSIQIKLDEDPIVFEHTTLVLMREGLILTIHPVEVDRRYSRLRRYFVPVLRKIATAKTRQDKLALLLMRIIETNNDRNFEHLREIEGHGDTLNKNLMDPKTPRNLLGPQIYNMKHGLIIYLDALWGSIDVIRDLRYGDAV